MKRVPLFWLFSLLWATSSLAGPSVLNVELQELLHKTLQDSPKAPGVILFVVCPAIDLEWSSAVGTVSLENDEPLTPEHTFRIASNTKTYVAASVLRLVEMGRLDLEDPVEGHLPDQWRRWLADDGYDLQAITLRMILSHTAGLNDHASDDRYTQAILADPQRNWLPGDQIRSLTEWFDPVGDPGEQFSYSDDGYIILGRIVELSTGLSLGPAVRSLLDFESLGLQSTWWEVMEEEPEHMGPRAHQYLSEFDTTEWNPSLDLYGGGGLVTDVRDLAYFTRKLIKGDVLHSEAMLLEMTGSGTADYRLGLFCKDLSGSLGWGHSGFWNTFVYHFPALDLTISGCILNHEAVRGDELAKGVVPLVAAARQK
jgi:D-alanyl-D-alanine carboxypeptidase